LGNEKYSLAPPSEKLSSSMTKIAKIEKKEIELNNTDSSLAQII